MPDKNIKTEDKTDDILFMNETGEFQSLGKDDFEVEKPVTSMIDTGKEELMLQPPPPVIRKNSASFYFHTDDEEEVAKIIPLKDLPSQKNYSLDKILGRVVTTFNLTLNLELKKRLRAVIYAFLRDRRTNVETEEVLKRKKIEGGMEFEAEQVVKVLKFLVEVKAKILNEKGLVIDETVQTEEKSNKPLPSVIKNSLPQKSGLVIDKPQPKADESMAQILAKKPEPVAPVTDVTKRPQPLARPKPLPTASIKRPVARKTGKTAMDDIQKDYKLVGPVEELASLTLQTFRRLGKDASSQSEKIGNKVSLLERQSIIKKAHGIQAWRRSPLYKMYLAIGQASMEHGLPVHKIIEQYITEGKEILTLEEFEAISDLNKQFRF